MRTTIRLDETLLREAKARAASAGRSLNDFIEEAIRLSVMAPAPAATVTAIPVLAGGRGLRPGVNLDSNADLLDTMDQGDGAR